MAAPATFESIVWLTGMPRSGTNWGSQILASCPDVRMKFCPLFSYEFKNRLDAGSSREQWDSLLREVYSTRSDYLDQDYLRRDGLVPCFEQRLANPSTLGIKSTRFHDLTPGLIDKLPQLRLVVLVRHPVAAIHSWLTSAEEFPAEAVPRQQWRSGTCRKAGPGEFWGFEDWKRTTRTYLSLAREFPTRVKLLSYEALVASPHALSAELFEWAGLPWTEQTERFLEQSTSGAVNGSGSSKGHGRSVFKPASVANRWRAEAEPWLIRTIERELEGDELSAFLRSPEELAA